MLYRFIIASLLVFAYFVYKALNEKNNFKAMSGILTGGVSLAVSILVLPYFFADTGGILFTIFKSIRYGISAVAMGADPNVTAFFNPSEPLVQIYNSLLYIYYILGPLFASAFLLSFSKSIAEMIRFLGHRRVHIFSELNEYSLTLAKSIKESPEKSTIIFCSSDPSSPDPLTTEANAIKALCSKKSIKDMSLLKSKKYDFYVLADYTEEYFSDLSALCSSLEKSKKYVKKNVTVRYIASSGSLELIRELDRTYGSEVNLRPLDPYSSQAIRIFRKYKDKLAGKSEKRFMIIGAGQQGFEILRNSVTLMTEPDSDLHISIIDKNAKKIISVMKSDYPEVFNLPEECYLGRSSSRAGKNYDITFHDCDIRDHSLIEALNGTERPDLIFITTGDDELNYVISRKLMRFYGQRSDDLSYPDICVRIRSAALLDSLQDTEGIFYFGNTKDIFNINDLVDPEYESSAKRVHLTYLGDMQSLSDEKQEEILEKTGFYSYVNQDSSFNEAVSMDMKYAYILSRKTYDCDDIEFVKGWLEDETNLISLSDAEHLRWNAYQRFQGWQLIGEKQEEQVAILTGGKKVKSDDLLLHPAMVPVEDLPEAEKFADDLLSRYSGSPSHTRYVELDRDMCRNLLYILGK